MLQKPECVGRRLIDVPPVFKPARGKVLGSWDTGSDPPAAPTHLSTSVTASDQIWLPAGVELQAWLTLNGLFHLPSCLLALSSAVLLCPLPDPGLFFFLFAVSGIEPRAFGLRYIPELLSPFLPLLFKFQCRVLLSY